VYDNSYYKKRTEGERRADAQRFAEQLQAKLDPKSVIDFGCAVGHYLERFYEQGITVHGVEGNANAFEYAVIPEYHLEEHDLRKKYDTTQTYDLALCIEVAEHLSEPYADTLVKTVTEAADTVVFTAATPGQGGTHHVNEQPRSYWIKKFEDQGFEYCEVMTNSIARDVQLVETEEVTENLFIFCYEC